MMLVSPPTGWNQSWKLANLRRRTLLRQQFSQAFRMSRTLEHWTLLKPGNETVLETDAVVDVRPADHSAMSRYSLRRRVVAPNREKDTLGVELAWREG